MRKYLNFAEQLSIIAENIGFNSYLYDPKFWTQLEHYFQKIRIFQDDLHWRGVINKELFQDLQILQV